MSGQLHYLAVAPAWLSLEDEFVTPLELWKSIIVEHI